HASGNIGTYVNYTQGEPSRNILEMVIPDLRHPLRSILYQANKKEADFPLAKQVQLKTGNEWTLLELNTEPIKEKDFSDDLLLVVFRKITDIRASAEKDTTETKGITGKE